MKQVLSAMLVLWVIGVSGAAESVPAQLVALEPQIFPATERDRLTGLDFRMSISAFGNPARVNNELVLASGEDHDFSHEGFFLFEDPTFDTIPLAFVLDVPDFTDANRNGLADFFDVAAGVENVRTIGFHEGFQGAEEFSATWNRPAGSATGTVLMNLPFFGRRFTHTFSLLAFEGAYEFARAGTNRSGTVTLTNVVETNDVIAGGFQTRVLDTNTLEYERGSWEQTGSGFAYQFEPVDVLDRDGSNYLALVAFEDGFPGTSDLDYPFWLLILRSGDKNGNGVDDLVEAPPMETKAPQLRIEQVAEGLRVIAIGSGSFQLESITDLPGAVWNAEQSISITNEQSTGVSVPLTGTKRFFRLREL